MSPDRISGQYGESPAVSAFHFLALLLGPRDVHAPLLPARQEDTMDYQNSYLELGEYANNLIRTKARQLVGKAGFTFSDCQDIEQELALDLIQRLDHYDATRAKRTTFMARIVDHRVATLIQERTAACRDWRKCRESLDEPTILDDAEGISRVHFIPDPNAKSAAALAFELDLQAALEQLPPDLRELWDLLIDSNIHRVSKQTGVPRSTLYARLKRLHDALRAAGL